ncbi:MAG: hypothetical protein LW817_03950 [Candidatus Caenarcaniphilales bacterium]|jgi:hypothetical protein|nr:hypothetical protein [Candidatus Caenarcaniphilales bacterium]
MQIAENSQNLSLLDKPILGQILPSITNEKVDANIINPNENSIQDLHQTEKPKETNDPPKTKNKYSGLIDKFVKDSDYRNISISGINAFLHAVATITNFTAKKSTMNKFFNDAAFFCTRWVAPLISYGTAAWTAFENKRGVEGLIKIIPPAFLPTVGDANIDAVFGFSTGLNQPYDMVMSRLKEKAKTDSSLAEKLQKGNSSFGENISMITNEFKNMLSDFAKGKMKFWEGGIYMINCAMILAGSLPMMLFARQDRNSTFAKGLGFLRNIGGILGDIGLVFGSESKSLYKFVIGVMCSMAAVADIAKRWVNDDVAKILIHLGAALNVSAYAIWNAFNSKAAAEQKMDNPVLVS